MQEMEREINCLQEKVMSLEEKLINQDKKLEKLMQMQQHYGTTHHHNHHDPNHSKSAPPDHTHMAISIQNIDQNPESADLFSNSMHQQNDSNKIPSLSQQQSSQLNKSRFICHQCHSEIISDNPKNSMQKAMSYNSQGNVTSSQTKNIRKSQKIDKQIAYNENQQRGRGRLSTTDGISQPNAARIIDDNENSQISSNEFGESDSHFSYDCQDSNFSRLSSDHNNLGMYRQSEESNVFSPQNNKQEKDKSRKLDFAYLYADPLVYKNKENKLVPINQPLDTEKEIKEIQKIIQQSKKSFVMRKEAVNFETLQFILAKQPKMIHISCHGDFDQDMNQYYLAFEGKDSGILDKLTEDRFRKLLGENGHNKVHLVFVSACHSEMIGKIFLRAKIPVVVAVNSHSLILDEVCQLFSRHFYSHLLVGYTPKESFQKAQNVVQGSTIEKYSCCCAHDHLPGCRWEKYAQKNGYEQAHEIHTPNCNCTFEQNKHKQQCKFNTAFNKALYEFEDAMNIDMMDDFMSDVDGIVHVCCCQPKLPHDESIKFILNGSEEATNTVLFQNQQEGQLIVEADVNLNNKLPQIIDSQMLVGRNSLLQQIVKFLFEDDQTKRLIHIYGSSGVGKSAIAKYAAKYTSDRRKFVDGVYYIEIQNRNSGQGLVSKICQKLMIDNCNKEQLCHIIKSSNVLILIDKCQKIIEEGCHSFNKTLKYIIENTGDCKIVVVTINKEDVTQDVEYKVQIEIPELTRLGAAKLLLVAAGTSKYLKHYQNPKELMNHKIFDMIRYKPSGILQMAPLLMEKSLDEIARQKQEEIKREQENQNMMMSSQIFQNEFGEFTWIMNISYRELKTKFNLELNLLYLICQTPAGLYESDIEFICSEKPNLYGDWEKFIKVISQDDTQIQTQLETDNKSKDSKKESKCSFIGNNKLQDKHPTNKKHKVKGFRFVTSNFSNELQENHFIPQPIVCEYINSLVLTNEKRTQQFQESFRYLSKLSRRLLRSIKLQKKREVDLNLLSAEIDIGIWSDQMTQTRLTDQDLEKQMVYNAEAKFDFNEGNFMGQLDQEILKQNFAKLDYKNVFSQYLDELCLNITSIYLMLGRYDEAIQLIDRCKQILTYFDLRFAKGKLLLIQASILLKKQYKNKEVFKTIESTNNIFMDLEINEGIAESEFLKALALIQNFAGPPNYLPQNFKSTSMQVSSFHHFERSNSYEQELGKFNSNNSSMSIQHQMSTPTNQLNNLNQFNQSSFKNNNSQQREAEMILQSLIKSRKFFKKVNCEFGIAKNNIIQAEFQIEKNFGIGGVYLESEPQQIQQLIQDALVIFEKFGLDTLVARCLRTFADLKYNMNEFFEAKQYIEQAIKKIKKTEKKEQESQYTAMLNKIFHQIRISSNNVFLFLKAFPIVEVFSGTQCRVVGTFTRYPSDFRKRIIDSVKKQNKVVNLKFDNLNKETLEYIRDFGCRVLHISSDVYHQDCLCIEGKNSEIEYIPANKLKEMLRPMNGGRLNVDVIVLAIPESIKLAQIFTELGVPHVIGFDFKQKLVNTFVDNIYTRPKKYDYIYDFCVEFYKNLIQEKSLITSLKEAKPRLSDGIRQLNDKLGGVTLTKEDVGQGPLVFPQDQNHKVKIFDNQQEDERYQLKPGNYLESSKVRGPTNLQKVISPYTGRQIETHKMLSGLKRKQTRIVNLIGLEGIGKTRFVQEVAYTIFTKYEFQDGIFIFSLKRIKQLEQLKEKLKVINIGGGQLIDLNQNLSQKSMLIILDDVDSLIKHNKTQFEWWILSIFQQCEKVKLIITSKKQISMKSDQKIDKQTYFIKLKPLNEIEAVDMILSYCTRKITKEELLMPIDSNKSIHHQLQQESSVKKCYGFPKYLEIFAKYLEYHSFDKIDIKNYIPNSKRGQMKRLQKEQHFEPGRKMNLPKKNKKNNTGSNNSNSDQIPDSQEFLTASNANRMQIQKRSEEKIITYQIPDQTNLFINQKQNLNQEIIEEDEDDIDQSQFASSSLVSNLHKQLDNKDEEMKTSSQYEESKNSMQTLRYSNEVENRNDQNKDDEYFYNNKNNEQIRRLSGTNRSKQYQSEEEDENDDNKVIVNENGSFKPVHSIITCFSETKSKEKISSYKNKVQDIPLQKIDELKKIQIKHDIVQYSPTANNQIPCDEPIRQFTNGSLLPKWGQNIQLGQSIDLKQMQGLIDDFNIDCEDQDTLQILIPELDLNRLDSVQSQYPCNEYGNGRSRSNSGAYGLEQSQQFRSGKGFNLDDVNMVQSEYAPLIEEIGEKVDEEDKQDSNLLEKSKELSSAQMTDIKNKFDLDDANSANSEEYHDEDDGFELPERKPLSKQQSLYTTSSGQQLSAGPRSQQSFHVSNSKGQRLTKQQQVVKLQKEQSRQEFGPRSGRNKERFKKKSKNQYNEVGKKQQEMKKEKKRVMKEKKNSILMKQESGLMQNIGKNEVDDDNEEKKMISNNQEKSHKKNKGNKKKKQSDEVDEL